MERIRRLFGGLNLTWNRLAIFAVASGVYTGVMAMLPAVRDTSFHDIAMTFEWWVLFGVMIIMNSASSKDAAAKCFVFFLISQPLVYLVQAPFHPEGLRLFRYYPGWFVWTLLTVPMGYIGYMMKRERWWALLILTPVLVFLGFHYEGFLSATASSFPRHLLSAAFCAATMIVYPLCLFDVRRLRRIGLIISVVILLVMTVAALKDEKEPYSAEVMYSGADVAFDESCRAYLTDETCGRAEIMYDEEIGACCIRVVFGEMGETQLILEYPDGTNKTFALTVGENTYQLRPQ